MAAQGGCRWEERVQSVSFWISDTDVVRRAAAKCGVQPWVVIVAGATWFLGFALWGYTGELICTVVGSVYPMYASFRALEDRDYCEVTRWLTYWVTVVAVMLTEGVLYRLFCWLPFYHIVRLLFVAWLFVPFTRGAPALYAAAVAPLLRRHRPAVDGALGRCSDELRGTLAGKRNEALRRTFANVVRSASPAAGRRRAGAEEGASTSKSLGIQELLAQELAKEAALRLGQAAATAVDAGAGLLAGGCSGAGAPPVAYKPVGVAARRRADSPGPPPMAPTPPMDGDALPPTLEGLCGQGRCPPAPCGGA